MRAVLLTVLVLAVFALHQDVWFWDEAHPIVLGVLPIGLAYHVLYSIVVAGVMWILVRLAWPADLEGPR